MLENKNSIDEELFQRIKKGDAGALKVLFEKYFFPLSCFAKKFVKNIHLAEEIVSDVFLTVWLKRERIEIKINLRTYLYTAVRNQSFNYLKKNKIHLESIETAVQENAISDLPAERLITDEELEQDINALLRQLPEQRQIIFRMNRIDGLHYKEIAEILSISVHTVQNQMVAAVKFLTDKHPHSH
jgi:RNA polymerase sigma-70 factor (ECF subfamily)